MTESSKEVSTITFSKAVALKGRKAIEFFSCKENIDDLIEAVKKEATATVFDVSKKKDRDAIGSIALKVSQSRKALTEASNASINDLQAQVKATKDVNKHWEAQLNAIRKDVLAPRDEWQEEQNKIEEARIAEIKARIAGIHAIGGLQGSETKQDIANLIDAVDIIDVADGFAEFAQEAAQAVKDVLKVLNDQVLVIVEHDRKLEQDRLLQEANQRNAIAERLNKLRSIPMDVLGKSAEVIQNKITSIQNVELSEDEFGESFSEAVQLVETVIDQLGMMMDQAILLEKQMPVVAEPVNETIPVNIEGVVTGADLVQPVAELSIEHKHLFNDDHAEAAPEDMSSVSGQSSAPEFVFREKLESKITINETLANELADWADRFSVSLEATNQLEEILIKYNQPI